MRLFWLRGYETTSLAELLKAMEVTTPSIYSAFGDKEHLFLETIKRYIAGPGSHQTEALREKTAKEAVMRILSQTVDSLVDPHTPPGCMLTLSAINCSVASACVQQSVTEARQEMELALCLRIERGIEQGDVPASTDAAALAGFYSTFLYGMSIKSLEGVTREQAQAMVDAALRAWPAD